MAKKKTDPVKRLLPPGEVKVKSRAYGEHTRAARGSKTPVAINEVLKENVRKTAVINHTAKRVHDLLKHCAQPFKEKMLWQVMLGRMRKATSENMTDLLMTLKGMELNSRYPVSRFAHPLVLSAEWNPESCSIVLSNAQVYVQNDEEYRYQMFLLMLGTEPEDDKLVSEMSEWTGKEKAADRTRFAFAVPSKVACYVVCLHLMTGQNGRETGTLASRGIKILDAGKGNYEPKEPETSRV